MSDDHPTDAAVAAIAAFADHLVPEAFTIPTAATRVTLDVPPERAAGAAAPPAFDAWMAERLAESVDVRWPDGGHPLAVAFLADGRLVRRFDEPGCGHLHCVTTRVRAESFGVAEPWVFAVALPRPAELHAVGRDLFGRPLDPALHDPDERRWIATCYGEARGRGAVDAFAWQILMDGDDPRRTTVVSTREHPLTRQFHRMLSRHPARKRHRLR